MGWLHKRGMLAAALALLGCDAGAVPFISLDVRANAMGGAGVASAHGANAPFGNPALLLMARERQAGNYPVPVAGLWRSLDPKNIRDELDRYQAEELEPVFETALTNYKSDPLEGAADLRAAADELGRQVTRFTDRAIEEDVGAGTVLNISDRKMALLVSYRSSGGGKMVGAAEDVKTYLEVINAVDAKKPVDDKAFNVVVSGPDRTLKSKLQARGAAITEVGLALAREVEIWGRAVALGVTPKYLNVATFDYWQVAGIASFSRDGGGLQHNGFNVDLGLAHDHGAGWRSGLAFKNLIPQDYETGLDDGVVRLRPQARAGVAYSGSGFDAVLDLDLVKGKALGFESDTQYLAAGVEVDLTKSLRLRGGYRQNISDNKSSAVTLGAGLVLFGVATDIAASVGKDELGLSAQAVINF